LHAGKLANTQHGSDDISPASTGKTDSVRLDAAAAHYRAMCPQVDFRDAVPSLKMVDGRRAMSRKQDRGHCEMTNRTVREEKESELA
jgi:hypothetical protein